MAGTWRKSSYSFSNGGCIEAVDWRKSRQSKTGNYIEVASGVAVRDTQDREGPVLKFSAGAWRAFTVALRGRCCGGNGGCICPRYACQCSCSGCCCR